MSQNVQTGSAVSPPISVATSDESISNLRPYGSLTICEVTCNKTSDVLSDALNEAVAAVNSPHRKTQQATNLRQSQVTHADPALKVQVLTWQEDLCATHFTDGRRDVKQHHLVVASDGEYLAFNTSSSVVQGRLRKWSNSKEQSFVRPLPMQIFREIAGGCQPEAAWLRNTAPRRDSQFTALAVTGVDVGQGAVELDLTAYQANTVRGPHDAADGCVERVTVNPSASKMSFRATSEMASWCELAGVAFAWITDAVDKPVGQAMLSGTAELATSLECIGEPYEVLIRQQYQELMEDDAEDGTHVDSTVTFELVSGQPNDKFEVKVYLAGRHICNGLVELRLEDGRWNAGFRVCKQVIASPMPDVASIVEENGIEIHFSSEHLYSGGVISHRPATPKPFRSYRWKDFGDETDIYLEKPSDSPSEMRRLLGSVDDCSLFGWVIHEYNKGWLVCDDGAHETADFIRLSDDQLTLLPIKAAKRGGRSTSTEAIQIVQAQAAKNLPFLDNHELLYETLLSRREKLVVFLDGVRQAEPDQFLSALANLHAAPIQRELVIVQPQLQRSKVAEAHDYINIGRRKTIDLGMMRIDSMLRSLDSTCANLGIGLTVVGQA